MAGLVLLRLFEHRELIGGAICSPLLPCGCTGMVSEDTHEATEENLPLILHVALCLCSGCTG